MSITALIWLALFLTLSALAFKRSVFGFGVYLLTFYASPIVWWWGDGLLLSIGNRWNLVASLIFLAATFFDSRPKVKGRSVAWLYMALLAYLGNAVVVHFLMADNPGHSYDFLDAIWKNCLLTVLLINSIRSWEDLRLAFLFILIGSAYLGYEVVFNDEGHYDDGRLEQISISGVNGANAIATLLSFCVPVGVVLLLFTSMLRRAAILPLLILTVEVILRCVSRGNMLGWILSTTIFLVIAKGRSRQTALKGFFVCGVVALFFMGPKHAETFITRFTSIFAESEARDVSVTSRLDFTAQGLAMIKDYPFGSGGEAAFRSNRGLKYIARVGETGYRSCHNGYVDIAASWGVQGLLLFLIALLNLWLKLAMESRRALQDSLEASIIGSSLCAMLVLQMVCCYFGSFLDGEWFYWWIAFAAIYLRLCDSRAVVRSQDAIDENHSDLVPSDHTEPASLPE